MLPAERQTREVTDKFTVGVEMDRRSYEELLEERKNMELTYEDKISKLQDQHGEVRDPVVCSSPSTYTCMRGVYSDVPFLRGQFLSMFRVGSLLCVLPKTSRNQMYQGTHHGQAKELDFLVSSPRPCKTWRALYS